MRQEAYVYILMNKTLSVPYIGVTNDLVRRIWEHKNKVNDGFTKKYNCNRLVYYECYDCIEDAILREKRLKNWHKAWKLNLIQRVNPGYRDLSEDLGF